MCCYSPNVFYILFFLVISCWLNSNSFLLVSEEFVWHSHFDLNPEPLKFFVYLFRKQAVDFLIFSVFLFVTILFIFSCNSLSFYVSFHKVNNCFFYLLVCPLYLVQCWSHSWCLIHISRLIIKTSKFPCFLNFAKHRLVLLCRNSAIFFVRACPVP